jgi:hypothetical protein
LEQIEEDGLVALAKTIIDRAEEKISLESELRKLRGIEEETDMIFPGNDKLEEFDPLRETVVRPKSTSKPPAGRGASRPQHPTQLLLFTYVS